MSGTPAKFLSGLILPAGIVAALLHALPAWFFLPDSAWLESLFRAEQARPGELILHPAWAGALAGRGLAGIYGSVFGAALAETLLALIAALVLLLLAAGVCRIAPSLARPARVGLLLLFAGVSGWGAFQTYRIVSGRVLEEQVRLPVDIAALLLEKSAEGRVFANPSAARALAVFSPGLKTSRWTGTEAGIASGGGEAWRKLDSENSFRAVVLSGRAGEFRPLLEFLTASPVWTPALVDAHGVVFLRRDPAGAGRGTFPDAAPSAPEGMSARASGLWLARQAVYLAAGGENSAARRRMEEAVRLSPDSAPVAALRASFFAERGQFPEAAGEARRALAIAPGYVPALQALVQCEIAMARPSSAWEAALKLEAAAPDDVYSLYLCARAANAAKITHEESRLLERAILLAGRRGIPDGAFRIYLGQARARRGFARQALAEWDAALAGESLSIEQIESLRELREALNESHDGEQ